MIVVSVKSSQILPKLMNWRSQMNFYVDDSYTKGLKMAKFGSVITGESGGKVEPVITYAGHVGATYSNIGEAAIDIPALKAVGLIYESSSQDQYRRLDDLSDETRLFPKGSRQDRPYALMPSGVLEITDTDQLFGSPVYFRAVDKVIPVADISSFDNGTATIVLSGEFTDIREEERFDVEGIGTAYVISVSYDDGADETTIVLNDGVGDVPAEITVKSQLFEVGYLPDDATADVPFTMIPVDDGGDPRQPLGFVESPIAFRFDVVKSLY